MSRTLLIAAWMFAASAAVAAESPRDAMLVTPAWLAEHIKDKDLVLLHVGKREDFDAGHIEGARFVQQNDVAAKSSDPKALFLELPTPADLHDQLELLGISDNSKVVVYYGQDWVSPSTRIIFTLDAAGLGKNVKLLDGGMGAWTRTGHTLSKAPGPTTQGKLSPLTMRPLVVDADFVQSHKGQPGYKLIDGRSANFYSGKDTGGDKNRPHKAGHIPGAKNIPFDTITDADLKLKPAAELAAMFTAAGAKPGDTIIGYCHIGQQGTAMLFAARSLGYKVVLYDGSFEDWSRRDLPAEK